MAHFAQIDEHNIVQQVIVIANGVLQEPHLEFPATESLGQQFIADVLNMPGTWLQTSYNASFRGKYAGIGDVWDGSEFRSPVTSD